MNGPPPAQTGGRLILGRVQTAVERVIVGKSSQIGLALCCLLAGGHLLIEDLPGVGKTTLAHALARVLGLHYRRIQFTSDLLPADVLGVSVYEAGLSRFQFHPGPVFAQLVLADEINRATPKTQSALLEAMEERQVSVDGETRALPEPFFVVATQNPSHQQGTYPLPESQLDRFLMRIELGYPDRAAERELLATGDRRSALEEMRAEIDPDTLIALQEQVRGVHVSNAVLDYLQALLEHSRKPGLFVTGLSPRSGLALKAAAQAYAYLHGSEYVSPEHVQAVLPAVSGHRLKRIERPHESAADIAHVLLSAIDVP